MFPYFEVLWLKLYMTGIWIIIFLISFIVVARYLCKKWHQDFYKLFYWLPIALIITYFLWSYVHFFLNFGILPSSLEELKILFSPYNYSFHFIGILLWFVLSLHLFFVKIKRYENKKIWADIFFFSLILSLIPLGIFLMLGDNFLWKPSSSFLSLKPLTTESELNKFNGVYPIWLFLSIVASVIAMITYYLRKKKKQFGQSILGFVYLLLGLNIVFMFQQYPRYGVMSIFGITFDIKQYVSFFVIMFCLHIYFKWQQNI